MTLTCRGILNISIIIPTLNEEHALRNLAGFLPIQSDSEVIVSDGGSSDQTVNEARRRGFRVVTGAKGRGPQLNRGAAAACGDILFFLHGDTRPPADFSMHIHKILNEPGTAVGVFRLGIDAPGQGYRLIEAGTNIRSRFFGIAYGDQGIFVRRRTFMQAGGFPDQPLFEDYQLIRRLQKFGRLQTAPVAVTTSARRWQRLGPLRTTLINQILLTGYLLGVDPTRLGRFYYRQTG